MCPKWVAAECGDSAAAAGAWLANVDGVSAPRPGPMFASACVRLTDVVPACSTS
jgi:hypothetical protein